MKLRQVLVFLVLLGLIPISNIGAKVRVAVMNFTNKTGSDGLNYLSTALAEAVSAKLVEAEKIQVLERAQLKQVLGEIELQQSGLFDESQVIKVGSFSKAQVLFLGSYAGDPEDLRITLRAVDVETAKVSDLRSVKTNLKRAFDETSNAAYSMSAVIAGLPTGTLTVESNPSKAEVFVGGASIGLTPIHSFRLATGRHKIYLYRNGYYKETETINIGQEENKKIFKSLSRKTSPSYFSLSAGPAFFIPQDKKIKPSFGAFLRLSYYYSHLIVSTEFTFASLNHEETFANPFGGDDLTEARRYRPLMFTAHLGYRLFPSAKIVDIDARLIVGYTQIRDVRLNKVENETLNKLDMLMLGGALGFTFFPRARLNFFVEGRYIFHTIKMARDSYTKSTLSSDFVQASAEAIKIEAVGVYTGMRVRFGS